MNLTEHYANLYNESVKKIISDHYEIDTLIDSQHDNRFGVTLIVRPDVEVKSKIQSFLNELKSVEPEQYYYPDSDIHVTLLSIISCHEGFELSQISVPDYIELISNSIQLEKKFNIEFRGVTASDSCIMIQGFLNDETLNNIRNNLRTNFKNSSLYHTIDKRYPIQTAHSTVVRFRKTLTQKSAMFKILENYRDYQFGTSSINDLEFVFNDWYQRKEREKVLCRFKI